MISITIPVYNEAQNLPILYSRLREVLDALRQPWEVVLVNDGSTDGSDAVLDDLARQDQRVKVLHFRRNFGQTAAMMAGEIGMVIAPPLSEVVAVTTNCIGKPVLW